MAKPALHLLNDEMRAVRLAFLTSALICDVPRSDGQSDDPEQRQGRETLGDAFHHWGALDLQASGFCRALPSAMVSCIHCEPPAKYQFVVPPSGGSLRHISS